MSSAPVGIEAVIGPVREVSVSLTDGAQGVIDGTIEVETTAGRPPLCISVVRYAGERGTELIPRRGLS